MIHFNNSYSKLPENFYERVKPASFSNPHLLLFNRDLARDLKIDFESVSDERLSKIFSGQELLEGSEPLAQAYAAHQFGHFVPQLGDGRAHLLGETQGFDIQLKGSGQTRFSRRGDGRSALGPVIREYIVSEAMHALGVPTTRALAAVVTGEQVYRNEPEPGGVFTRVAASHLRVGTFQYFMAQEDIDSLRVLMNYAIDRHYPELTSEKDESVKALNFLRAVGKKQAELIAHWMSLGFIHGVMNTDNFSVAGITIDFGPCAFMDEYKENKVFSSIDRNGRYAYSNQIAIGQWNILRLADCLIRFIDEDQNKAIEKVEKEIVEIMELFPKKRFEYMAPKFGLADYGTEDDQLMKDFLGYLEKEGLDFTLSFRNLPELFTGESSYYPAGPELDSFLEKWRVRAPKIESLNTINPLYIPRNHQVERSIRAAYDGDYSVFKDMVEVLKNPFDYNAKLDHFKVPPKVDERVYQTFCGT